MKTCHRSGAFLTRLQMPVRKGSAASPGAALLILTSLVMPCSLFGSGPPQGTSLPPVRRVSQNRAEPKTGSSTSSPPAQAETKPLHDHQIEGLVKGGVNSGRVALLVDQRGIDFTPTVQFLRGLMDAGADDVLIQSIIKAKQIIVAPPTSPASLPPSRPATPAVLASGPAQVAVSGTATADPPAARESQETLQQKLDHAADLEQRHQWPEAEGAYREALSRDAKSAATHLGLARVLSQEQRWDEAVGEFRQGLQLDPGNAQAHCGLAAALAAKHDLAGSIAEYREAVRLNSNDAELHEKLGDALYANGELDAAAGAYRAALALKPNDAQIANRLGVALYAAGDMKDAVAAYRQAVQLDPKDAHAHNNLGDALLNTGDRRGALEEYHRAFELAPNSSTLGTSYAALAKQLSSPQPAVAGTNK